jgi:pyrimidine operon attenuation protein/uracil phosphoribosyltransferase
MPNSPTHSPLGDSPGDPLSGPFDAEAIYAHLLEQIRAGLTPQALQQLVLIGIHSGGAWVAERLHRDLGLAGRIGALDISFYRDDFGRIGLHPQVKPSDIPVDVAGASILLVDDILYTGRTIRGAMNVLFDYGRPARIDLAVLIDRGGRELPVEARWAGARFNLPSDRSFVLTREPADGAAAQSRFALTIEPQFRN